MDRAGTTALLARLGIRHPVVQAPMIGPKATLAAAVSAAGGLGSLGCAASSVERIRADVATIRAAGDRPFNLNFFAHVPAPVDAAREAAWRRRLAPYYAERGLDPEQPVIMAERAPFDATMAACVAEIRPAVASFHFGLPDEALLAPLRAAGCAILACATTVREARWLVDRGVDAVIAQGVEAGGHRGMFLSEDVATQIGTFALVPQVVDAVKVPVIAAGGIADGRGVAAALMLGAAAVQVGTAYLLCPEAGISDLHRAALIGAADAETALTNVFTGRPARGFVNRALRELGPLAPEAPHFPRAAVALQPLRAAAEASGSAEFTPLWSGQAAALARETGAAELTHALAAAAERVRGVY